LAIGSLARASKLPEAIEERDMTSNEQRGRIIGKTLLLREELAIPERTSAPDLPPSLAGFSNLLVYNISRQSLLRSGAA
jgi:hypothetical protein